MPILSGKPEQWLSRAKEARAMAATLKSEAAARAMLDIAESYEKVAERADNGSSETISDQTTSLSQR